jgi:hypothetical protein
MAVPSDERDLELLFLPPNLLGLQYSTCLFIFTAVVDILSNLPANMDPMSFVIVRYMPFLYPFFYLYYMTPRNLLPYTCG